MSVTEELAGREVMALPVSAGTSLAIEAACGQYPDRPVSPAPLLGYGEFWFNLRTLIRNMLSAVKADTRNNLLPQHVVPALEQEIGVIRDAIQRASSGGCVARFYFGDYSSLKRDFPYAVHRTLKGDRMIFAQTLEDISLKELTKRLNVKDQPPAVNVYTYQLPGCERPTLLLSHAVVDLLCRPKFPQLDLVESNTGVIKPAALWYTKLTDGKHLPPMPFNRFTLQVFGDNGTHFAAMPRSIRELVIEMARRDHWTPLTTVDRMKASIAKVTHKADADVLRRLF